MGKRLVIILSIAAILSFVSGQLAGKRAMGTIDASMSGIMQSMELAEKVNQMNQTPKPKVSGPKSLAEDPQL